MGSAKTLFIFSLILQTGLAGTIVAVLSKEGAFLSMGILSALIFLSVLIALMIFWSKKLKYLYMYIMTIVLWLILTVFLFLDIFGIFHILASLDNLIIGKTAINNYKANKKDIPSLLFILFIALMVFMVISAILSCFVQLKQNVKQIDEYGNEYRASKKVSIYNNTMKKTRFASEVITINNSDNGMDGDPGITVIPNNNYYGGNLNNYDMLPTDEAPFLNNRPKMDNDVNFNSLRRMKNETQMTNTRYDNDYYSRDNISPVSEFEDSIKYNTLSSAKPKSPISPLKNYDEQRSSTFDRSYASRRGQEARENNERERNRERIRERERERLRERNKRDRDRRDRDRRDRDRRDRDRGRNERDRYDDDEMEEKELHPGNISTREELETYINKSSMEISKSMSMAGNPKFVSMFEIEENASDASDEEDDFTMNHFTIKCKICKKDIPIEEVENHKCESANIPLINVETEEHKKEMEEKARKEREEKERLEREKKEQEEKERLEKEKEEEEKRAEREKNRQRRRERERERERDRDRDRRDRDRRRDERSRDRDRDRRRDERSRDRDRDRRRDERSRDRKRRDNKEAEWEQRYNTKDKDDHKSHERDRSRRRKDDNEIREGARYEITKEYDQVLNDEVTVKYGHVFEVEKVFEDGWCVGTNLSTNKWGAIPMNCLNSRQERKRRIQSLYMA